MNLTYAPNLQIGDLVLITDGNYLSPVIVSSFTKTNKPRIIKLGTWWVDNFTTTKYLEFVVVNRYLVKIDKSQISLDKQKIYEDLKQLILLTHK